MLGLFLKIRKHYEAAFELFREQPNKEHLMDCAQYMLTGLLFAPQNLF